MIAMSEFLTQAGWPDASLHQIAGDASARQYHRVTRGAETAILMIDPSGGIPGFVRVTHTLRALGLAAPAILHEAPGYLLTQDLGDALFAMLCAQDPTREPALYDAATDVLVALHKAKPPEYLPRATPDFLSKAITLAFEFYHADPALSAETQILFHKALTRLANSTGVIILRDYHAENLLWQSGKSGVQAAGLIDYQDALAGHPAYDLASLCTDARRDLGAGIADRCIARYLAATGTDPEAFHAAFAVLAAQRNLRILGIFARLALRDGKTKYLSLVPRVWQHLMTSLNHPDLRDLHELLAPRLTAPENHPLLQKALT